MNLSLEELATGSEPPLSRAHTDLLPPRLHISSVGWLLDMRSVLLVTFGIANLEAFSISNVKFNGVHRN